MGAPQQDRGSQEARQRVLRARESPERRASLLASLLRGQPRRQPRRALDRAALLGGGAGCRRRVPQSALRLGRLGGGGGGTRVRSVVLGVTFVFDGLQITFYLAVGIADATARARGRRRLG